jgi:hypothetical protein
MNLPQLSPRRVVIKGSADDQAVLCTHNKTYALKSVETTNLLLLIPPNQVKQPYVRTFIKISSTTYL